MATAVVLFILTCGFIFTSMNPICRYKQIRSPGWALYLHSFSWGLAISFVPFLLFSYFSERINNFFCKVFSDDISSIAIIPFSLILWGAFSILLAYSIGFFLRKSDYICNKALQLSASENDLKQYILEAAKSGELVQITLESRKVYIGFIVKINPEDMMHKSEYISFWPTLSGFRSDKTLSLKITNNYQALYDSIMKDVDNKNSASSSWSDIFDDNSDKSEEERVERMFKMISRYLIVIPSSTITHMGHFDITAYKKINQNIHHKKRL